MFPIIPALAEPIVRQREREPAKDADQACLIRAAAETGDRTRATLFRTSPRVVGLLPPSVAVDQVSSTPDGRKKGQLALMPITPMCMRVVASLAHRTPRRLIATTAILVLLPVPAIPAAAQLPPSPRFVHGLGQVQPLSLPAGIKLPHSWSAQRANTPALRQGRSTLTATDGQPGDHLGGPVTLSGGTALVGAWDKQQGTGAVYVFVRRQNHWTQQAELTAPDGHRGDWFGNAVALSGDTALVGASLAGNHGAAYIFVRHGTIWTEQAILIAHDHAPADWFGRTVALSGDTALVGSWYHQDDIGSAYVFVRRGSTWTEQAKLTATDASPGDFFATSVALAGDTAVVGAAGVLYNSGAAYVFARRQGRWVRQAELRIPGEPCCATFGTAVALRGATLLVSAGFAHANRGAVYVFVRSGRQWHRQATLLAANGQVGDWFGRAVALSGDRALVGAWYRQQSRGAAYLFVRRGNHWNEEAELIAADGQAGDNFGSSVAINGKTDLVGAGFRHHATGAVYVFDAGG